MGFEPDAKRDSKLDASDVANVCRGMLILAILCAAALSAVAGVISTFGLSVRTLFSSTAMFYLPPRPPLSPLTSALRAAAASRYSPSGAADKNIQKVAASFIPQFSGERS